MIQHKGKRRHWENIRPNNNHRLKSIVVDAIFFKFQSVFFYYFVGLSSPQSAPTFTKVYCDRVTK